MFSRAFVLYIDEGEAFYVDWTDEVFGATAAAGKLRTDWECFS
jgi:hypothetical protein